MVGSVSGWPASTSSQSWNPGGTSPPNTRKARTFVSRWLTSAMSGACSASTTTSVASELSMTYAISSALKRYERGTAVSDPLRAAWTVTSTSSEFGPHHTMRSRGWAPERDEAVRGAVHQRVERAEVCRGGSRATRGVDDDRGGLGVGVGVDGEDVGHRSVPVRRVVDEASEGAGSLPSCPVPSPSAG